MCMRGSAIARQQETAPGAWGGGRGRRARAGGGGLYDHYSPLVLEVFKSGSWRRVAKLVPLWGELVLAVPYRHRPALEGRVSLPEAVLIFALLRGARWLVVRFDLAREAYRLKLEEVWRRGWAAREDGILERFVPLEAMDRLEEWPEWPYVTRCVRLGPGPDECPRQLTLALEEAQ